MTVKDDDALPTWWWALNAALFALAGGIGLMRMQGGEDFSSSMFLLYAVMGLAAIPLLSREWRRYRAGR